MDDTVLHYVLHRISNAKVNQDPYPYFHIENIFPEKFYQELLANLPDDSSYVNLSQTGRVPPKPYKERYVLPLQQPELNQLPFRNCSFWKQFASAIYSDLWVSNLLEKFKHEIQQRFAGNYDKLKFSSTAELVRDRTNCSISPHTEHPIHVLTLLFYFPSSLELAHLGTSVYSPLDPSFTCEGLSHHPAERFIKSHTIPFLPNSVFGFIKSDRSFHGIEPIKEEKIERNLMNYYLRWEEPDQ